MFGYGDIFPGRVGSSDIPFLTLSPMGSYGLLWAPMGICPPLCKTSGT